MKKKWKKTKMMRLRRRKTTLIEIASSEEEHSLTSDELELSERLTRVLVIS